MGKHENQGYVEKSFPWDCWNCCCHVCTGRNCPDKNKYFGPYRFRCADCVKSNGAWRICLECDYFENKHTSRRRFKVRRRWHREDAILSRLDKIMKKLDVPPDEVPGIPRHNYIDDETRRLVEEYSKKIGAG